MNPEVSKRRRPDWMRMPREETEARCKQDAERQKRKMEYREAAEQRRKWGKK